jgi:hypothetical protein
MASGNYFYLIAGLPDLSIDQGKLQFGSLEFREYLRTQLTKEDYQLIEWLFLPYDNQNLLSLLTKREAEWQSGGIYTREQLELAIMEEVAPDKIISDERSGVKAYLKDFIRLFSVDEQTLHQNELEVMLSALYYSEALKVKNKFLKAWFEFEINLKNLLVFHTAQKLSIPYEKELLNITDLAASLLSKVGRDVGEAAEWTYYNRIIQIADNHELAIERKVS